MVNINGLLNEKDVTDVIALDCERVNAQSTKQLYRKALEKHPQANCIYIISDNADTTKIKNSPNGWKGRKSSCYSFRLTRPS